MINKNIKQTKNETIDRNKATTAIGNIFEKKWYYIKRSQPSNGYVQAISVHTDNYYYSLRSSPVIFFTNIYISITSRKKLKAGFHIFTNIYISVTMVERN